jgi:hypothetical protein
MDVGGEGDECAIAALLEQFGQHGARPTAGIRIESG